MCGGGHQGLGRVVVFSGLGRFLMEGENAWSATRHQYTTKLDCARCYTAHRIPAIVE